LDLETALARYLSSGNARHERLQNIRFIRWCGGERDVESLTGEEIEQYREFTVGSANDGDEHLQPVREFLSFAYNEKLISDNLAQKLRFPRAGRSSRAVKGPNYAQQYTLTPEGIEELQQRLQTLQQDRQLTVDEIRKAAADKDVRENAPLEAARERQGHIDARIRELEILLRSASVVGFTGDSPPKDQVAPGRRILLRDIQSGMEVSYMLVDPPEANPMGGKLSTTSPVGRALLGQVVGAEVSVPTPRGTLQFRILSVE